MSTAEHGQKQSPSFREDPAEQVEPEIHLLPRKTKKISSRRGATAQLKIEISDDHIPMEFHNDPLKQSEPSRKAAAAQESQGFVGVLSTSMEYETRPPSEIPSICIEDGLPTILLPGLGGNMTFSNWGFKITTVTGTKVSHPKPTPEHIKSFLSKVDYWVAWDTGAKTLTMLFERAVTYASVVHHIGYTTRAEKKALSKKDTSFSSRE